MHQLLSRPSQPLAAGLLTSLDGLRPLIGNTPCMPLDEARINLFAKLEFYNFVGSVKDRAAWAILQRGIADGSIDRNTTVVESSSGNFACSTALICRRLGLKFVAVVDNNMNHDYLAFLERHAWRVVRVAIRDSTGGYLLARLQTVQYLLNAHDNWFWTNQYANPAALAAHYEGTGEELCQHFPSLDYVFVGVSSGGTIAGISQRIKERFPHTQVVAVDVEGSVIFGSAPRARHIPGIGASMRSELVDRAQIDTVVHVSELESVRGCHTLLHEHGLFAGGSSGSVFAAVRKFFAGHKSMHRPTVSFICADRGNAYLNTIYNPNWVHKRLGTDSGDEVRVNPSMPAIHSLAENAA